MIKVILPANEIPLNGHETVTKATGTKEYHLAKEVVWYTADGEKKTIGVEGCLFLCSTEGDPVRAIKEETPLVWFAEEEDIYEILQTKLYGDEDK